MNTDLWNLPPLVLAEDMRPVLVHSCCAVCSCSIMWWLQQCDIAFTVLFFNPSIFPEEEYIIRKEENKRYAQKLGVPFVDGDYDHDQWLELVAGLEQDLERGRRCSRCFEDRMQYTAAYARDHGFPLFATTLGISRWKDQNQVHAAGHAAASLYPSVTFWDFNWRKKHGSQRMSALSRDEDFYRQNYCGCEFSRRDG
ncbi:MAG: epoxyqueuosine reductase QueH [Spartobacteria bacterium]|nr:epoxyqueuosine reductase QueH [Spartobacteria bacterium]